MTTPYLLARLGALLFCAQMAACAFKMPVEEQAPIEVPSEEVAAMDWKPEPPMPDKYDWIQLKSGEWLKGEVITLYEDKMEFDSDVLGVLKIDEDDIVELRSHNRKSLRFSDGSVLEGQVYIKDEYINLLGAGMRLYHRDQLISIAQPETNGEMELWDGDISAGANLRKGNTDQTDYSAGFEAHRRTSSNRLHIKYLGAYTRSGSEETENNHRLTSQYDVFFSQRAFFRPVAFEAFSDPFQNISYRLTYSVGAGYTLMDTDDSSWDVSAGVGFQTTRFDTVLAGEDQQQSTPVLEFGTDYERDLTNNLSFDFSYSGQLVNESSGQYNHRIETGLDIDLIEDIDFKITFIWDRIEKPTTDSDGNTPDKDDTRLIFGLGYDF